MGKTNLHELALEGLTVSSLGGQIINPYDFTRTPGGSSGGTGAAIASSFAVFGTGSDTVNSLRSPASANSLFAFRPTRGLNIARWHYSCLLHARCYRPNCKECQGFGGCIDCDGFHWFRSPRQHHRSAPSFAVWNRLCQGRNRRKFARPQIWLARGNVQLDSLLRNHARQRCYELHDLGTSKSWSCDRPNY